MKRRDFLKFLGIGSAAAVVAPKVALAAIIEAPVAPAVTFKTFTTAWTKVTAVPNMLPGQYLLVRVPNTSLPFRSGDVVNYKSEWRKYHGRRERHVIAYKGKTFRHEKPFGIAMSEITPGNYGWICLRKNVHDSPVTIDFSAIKFEPETGRSPLNYDFEAQA